jgi:hypothetical protein
VDTTALKNAPNEIWSIPSGDGQGQQASVGQFEATDLTNYLASIDKLANSIAIITRTPKHYFYEAGSTPSGEALLAMESPLIKKVEQRETNFGVIWREIAAFILKISNKGEIPITDITPVWESAKSVQPLTEAQARKTSVEAGIPLETQVKREGWTETEVAAMDKDRAKESKRTTSTATAMLDQLRAEDAQSNENPGREQPVTDGTPRPRSNSST